MKLSKDLRCLVCQNEALADSRAELAVDLRNEIREQMRAGKSDKEIVAFLTARYGKFILYNPPVDPTTYLLWFGPFVLLLAGLVILFRYLKQRRELIVEQPLSEDEHNARRSPAQDCSGKRNRMMLFWLICAALVAIALAFVLPPLLQQVAGGPTDDGKTEANLDVYRDQLSELEADLRNGIISPEQYKEDREGIERRLLEDVPVSGSDAPRPVASSALKRQAVVLIVCSGLFFLTSLAAGKHVRVIDLLAQAQPTISIVLLTFAGLLLLMRSNRSTAYGLALALPILALSIYLKVGDLHASEPNAAAPSAAGMTQQGIEANVAALAKRLEQNQATLKAGRCWGVRTSRRKNSLTPPTLMQRLQPSSRMTRISSVTTPSLWPWQTGGSSRASHSS